jgi:hypothetical protein
MEEQMKKIRQNLKSTHDIQKIYANKNNVFRYFIVGEHFFLKVKAKISLLRLSHSPKLVGRYCGPFEILEKIGLAAYMIALHASMRVHNAFHVS